MRDGKSANPLQQLQRGQHREIALQVALHLVLDEHPLFWLASVAHPPAQLLPQHHVVQRLLEQLVELLLVLGWLLVLPERVHDLHDLRLSLTQIQLPSSQTRPIRGAEHGL